MKRTSVFLAAVFAAILGSALAGGEGWSSDFDAAKKQAAEGKKSMLIDFTGSDWCGWCIKLNKEVFVHDEFKTGVKDKFVLVELDYPRDKSKLTEATIAQNEELKDKYEIRGFPTILLADEEGKPFARTGYQAGGPEAYVAHLDELLAIRAKRDAAFAEADKAQGVEKAKSLVAALKSMELEDGLVANFYGDKIEAIKAADPNDESGYVKGVEEKQKFAKFQDDLNELGGKRDFDGALKLADETLASGQFQGDSQQQIMVFKGMIQMQRGKTEEAIKALDEAMAYAPESGLSKQIESLKGRFAQMSERKAAAEKAAAEKAAAEKEAAEKEAAEKDAATDKEG